MASATISRPGGGSRRRRATRAPIQSRDLPLIIVAALGLLVSAYLAFVDLAGSGTLCLAGADCDIVRASAFGHVAGLPVAALGTAYFLAVLALAILPALRWHGPLQILGGVGLGAAVTFIGLQGLVLRAWCPYCLIADAAALAVAMRVLWPRRTGLSARPLMRGLGGASLGIIVLVVGFAVNAPVVDGAARTDSSQAGAARATMSADQLAALADHLRESGAVFYGAYWCPHCQAQKQMFGAAASRLPYVECDARGAGARPDVCQAAGVRAYPTWIIGGQTVESEISPGDLARISGFQR